MICNECHGNGFKDWVPETGHYDPCLACLGSGEKLDNVKPPEPTPRETAHLFEPGMPEFEKEFSAKPLQPSLMHHSLTKWDERFLRLAGEVASWSKDPSTKAGCVIVDEHRRVIATGYNGFPRKMPDVGLENREHKYSRTIHAEMNALMFATRAVEGATLYQHPFPPCDRCAAHIIQAGISRVVAVAPTLEQLERWQDSMLNAQDMFQVAGVEFVLCGAE